MCTIHAMSIDETLNSINCSSEASLDADTIGSTPAQQQLMRKSMVDIDLSSVNKYVKR